MELPLRPSEQATALGNGILSLLAIAALALVVHNFGLTIFPRVSRPLPPGQIEQVWDFVYRVPLENEWGDTPLNWRNRAVLTEDGRRLGPAASQPEIMQAGRGRWSHQRGELVFATSDNSDPRTNGRTYALERPLFYSPRAGLVGGVIWAIAVLGLYGLNRGRPAAARPAGGREEPRRWKFHLAGALVIFALGLYSNTGTLAPYAITGLPRVDPVTGFPYNIDHPHFKVLFAFLEGAPRDVWDQAMLLRRILFPVIAWPGMKWLGFETGGTVTALGVNVAGLAAFLFWLRSRVGEKGAVAVGWLLSISPGATYWVGMPYSYALIFPGSLLLMIGLDKLSRATSMRSVAIVGLMMGVLYLGYDFAPLFLPASLLVLLWRRQWSWAAVSLAVQTAPLAAWLGALSWLFHQPVANNSSLIYRDVVRSYFDFGDEGWRRLWACWDVGWTTFFGANFIFLPALALLLVTVNPLTARLRATLAETALLAVVAAVFLFNNLPPNHEGWDMHGSWIARLYQPAFAAGVVWMARWWQHRPSVAWWAGGLLRGAVALCLVGNALIVFGPILGNPGGVSGYAFYRFYFNTGDPDAYARNLRANASPRLLGMPKPSP